VVEYADVREEGTWDQGFGAFVLHGWRHPAPGPLWFLEVLLLFSVGYALARTLIPNDPTTRTPLRGRTLLTIGALVAVSLYAVRIVIPFDREVGQDLFLGQAPVWVAGFTLGMVGPNAAGSTASPRPSRAGCSASPGRRSRAWFWWSRWTSVRWERRSTSSSAVGPGSRWFSRRSRARWWWPCRCGWSTRSVGASTTRAGVMRQMGRAAFAAFVVHQVVLVGTVQTTRLLGWPPEVDYLAAAAAAVIGSFGLGAVLVRLPGVRRVV
jgi:glucan biosynthesis protein C